MTEGSIIATVQFLGPLNFPNRIKHDITLREKMVLKPQWEAIVTKFPDLLGFDVSVYSLDEVLVEKIRSIMQRGYSRDYYDVWRLLKEDRVDKTEIKRLLTEKCELNGIAYRPDLIFDKNRLMEADAYWVKGLGYLTKDLPSFDAVVSDLRGMLDPLDL